MIVTGKRWLRKATENEHRTHRSVLAAKQSKGHLNKQFTRLEFRRKVIVKPQGRTSGW